MRRLAWPLAVALVLVGCSSDDKPAADSRRIDPQEWATVFERSSTRLLAITEGSPDRERHEAKCREARSALEDDRPLLAGAADEELASRGEQWADAFDDYLERCVEGARAEDPEFLEALRKANRAAGAATARLAELGVQHAP